MRAQSVVVRVHRGRRAWCARNSRPVQCQQVVEGPGRSRRRHPARRAPCSGGGPGSGAGGGLAGGQGQELGGEGLDLALDRSRVQRGEGVLHDRLVLVADPLVPLGSPVRSGRHVVPLGDLRAVADLEDQLLLGQESSSLSATAAPRSCSVATVRPSCRSGGSPPPFVPPPSSSAQHGHRRCSCLHASG